MSWWSCPEHEAVSWVDIPRLNAWVLDFLQDLIDDKARKVRGEEFGLLLGVAGGAVG